jgi:Predicted membrane protein
MLTALWINTLLIALAQRLPLLTRNGWIHAGALGTILWGCLGWRGWLAVVLYLALGSLVTKLGFAQKQAAGLAEARGGQRGPANVWGSALTGAVLALLIGMGVGSERLLLIGFAASFAAKLADTFGSEIGKRWGRTTVLITNLHRVPAGTEAPSALRAPWPAWWAVR